MTTINSELNPDGTMSQRPAPQQVEEASLRVESETSQRLDTSPSLPPVGGIAGALDLNPEQSLPSRTLVTAPMIGDSTSSRHQHTPSTNGQDPLMRAVRQLTALVETVAADVSELRDQYEELIERLLEAGIRYDS